MDAMADPAAAAVEFVVRPAQPRDATSFFEMWSAVVAEGRYVRPDQTRRDAGFYRRVFRRSWSSERVDLIAAAGERVIGHLTAAREEGSTCNHVASLGLAVAADWRGRGVGSALMEEAIDWGRTMGVEKLALSVFPHNQAAIEMYRRFGFVEEGRLSGHSKKSIGYVDEVVMGLWLIPKPRQAGIEG